jgi:predicted N-acyltransferase
MTEYRSVWAPGIADLSKSEWDSLAVRLNTPFLEWGWMNSLESSGSAVRATGWQPNHLLVYRGTTLIAIAPLYLKNHSMGEYIPDGAWSVEAKKMRLPYYPKLVGMSPFSPADGYRFLIAPDEDEAEVTAFMMNAIDDYCERHRVTGCHFHFVDASWMPLLREYGYLTYLHHSNIWSNRGYNDFDDFLKDFTAHQRQVIRYDRKSIANAGLEMKTFFADEIPLSLFQAMYGLYYGTCQKNGKGRSQYLNLRFFEQLYTDFRHRILFIAAFEKGKQESPVGMSFCITKGKELHTRYWGVARDMGFLHFEACYYAPVEWGIKNGVQTVDPGRGGPHKYRRGYAATPIYTMHRLYSAKHQQMLNDFLERINEQERGEITRINHNLPLKKDVLAEILASIQL